MPTTNPRVNVTLSPSLDGLVARLAAAQKVSKSQVLRELLETAEPALQRVVLLMEAATKASNEVRHGLGRSLKQATDQLEGSLATGLESLDGITGDLVQLAEAVRGRRVGKSASPSGARRSTVRQDPPSSNRGVKSPARSAGKPVKVRS